MREEPAKLERALERAYEHVSKARRIVTQQRRLVERLTAKGGNTADAKHTLDLFVGALEILEDNLRRHLTQADTEEAGIVYHAVKSDDQATTGPSGHASRPSVTPGRRRQNQRRR
jgi:hypothetical protein